MFVQAFNVKMELQTVTADLHTFKMQRVIWETMAEHGVKTLQSIVGEASFTHICMLRTHPRIFA